MPSHPQQAVAEQPPSPCRVRYFPSGFEKNDPLIQPTTTRSVTLT